jgi:ribosomal protein S18 acetylase RimI-like enzyme
MLYRPARVEDLSAAQELVVASINDLTKRHGFGPMASARPPHFQTFCLKDDPDGLWIAEDAGRIVGFALSWACDNLWFLAELFIAPDQQGRGVGQELLRRTLQHASNRGATRKALITFTFNRVSQGLYIRHGMRPRLPIYMLDVASDTLAGRLPAVSLRSEPLADTPAHLDRLASIDATALGVSRSKHHRYLLGDDAMKGIVLYDATDCVGYAYVSRSGHVGPLAASRAEITGAAFGSALALAAGTGAPRVSVFVPGTSDALQAAIEHGMRISFPMVLVSDQPFGDWRRYLPRNPGFM